MLGFLKQGLKAEITSSAFKKIFKGKVSTISSRIDPSTRSILARIIVDNKNFEIIPGQLMTVKIIYDETKSDRCSRKCCYNSRKYFFCLYCK